MKNAKKGLSGYLNLSEYLDIETDFRRRDSFFAKEVLKNGTKDGHKPLPGDREDNTSTGMFYVYKSMQNTTFSKILKNESIK